MFERSNVWTRVLFKYHFVVMNDNWFQVGHFPGNVTVTGRFDRKIFYDTYFCFWSQFEHFFFSKTMLIINKSFKLKEIQKKN